MTVTLAMLVREPPLDRMAMLLEYVQPVVSQTVVVVDDRTSSRARDVMAAWGVEQVPFTWCDDFAAARNAALPHVRGDWVLHLDPDELPSHAMLDFIRTVDASPWQPFIEWQGQRYHDPLGYLFFTHNWFDGRKGEEYEEHWHCRLFRAARGQWYKPVHEQVALDMMPEAHTRGTNLLPKAPRAAVLIHSRLENAAIDEQYVAIGERGRSGATA